MSHVTRMWATLACLPLLAAGLGVTSQTATASGAERAAAERVAATPYALKTRGYGSKVVGGEVPAGSDTTAFERIGCTNKTGKLKRNHEAEVEVPGLGVASGVTTTLRTTKDDGVVASSSVQRIASVELAESRWAPSRSRRCARRPAPSTTATGSRRRPPPTSAA